MTNEETGHIVAVINCLYVTKKNFFGFFYIDAISHYQNIRIKKFVIKAIKQNYSDITIQTLIY